MVLKYELDIALFMKKISILFLLLSFINFQVLASHGGQATLEDLKGITALYRCSGAFVDFGQKDTELALVLSAGHCSADSDNGYVPNRATVKRSIYNLEEYVAYYTKHIESGQMIINSFQLASIYYGTMTREDVTLFQTSRTLGQVKDLGIRVFKVADKLPKVGQKLTLTSGLWGQTQTCTVERIIANNAEEKKLFGTNTSPVQMRNTILLSKDCTGQGGWSGSPLFDAKTGLVYGVASRIYTPGPYSSLASSGVTPRILVSSLVELKKCINSKGHLALNPLVCNLPR